MRRAVAVAVVLALTPTLAAASGSGLPGARAIRVCAAAGPYWPTMTLALASGSAWVACKEQSRILRVATRTGARTATVRLAAPAIAVKAGLGSIWALDSSALLYRVDPRTAKVAKRIALPVRAPYNIWIGGGSVWVADDQSAQVVRVSPGTNRVIARVSVGDGPASVAFGGGAGWVVDHRDTTVYRVDLATNRARTLTTLGGNRAPERMVWARGSLWITGRGTDLLEVDPQAGAVRRAIEIGGSGIDVVARADELWVPARRVEVDPSGFPTMEALRRVDAASGAVATVARPSGRLDVHGLVAARGAVWLADNRSGYLYRVPAR